MSDARFWADLPEKLAAFHQQQERKADKATDDLMLEIESTVLANFIYPNKRRRSLSRSLRLTRKRP